MDSTQRQRYEQLVNTLMERLPKSPSLSCRAKNNLLSKIKSHVCDHIMYKDATTDDNFIDELHNVMQSDIIAITDEDVNEYKDYKDKNDEYKEYLLNILRQLLPDRITTIDDVLERQYHNSVDHNGVTNNDDVSDDENEEDKNNENVLSGDALCGSSAIDDVIDEYINECEYTNSMSNYVSEYAFLQKAIKDIPERVVQ